ncbi:hypothetical protein [Streptomyces formicae]
MATTTYTIEIMSATHVLTEVPAGDDETAARELFAACEAAAQPGKVECLCLTRLTIYGPGTTAWDSEHTYDTLLVS